MVSTDGRTDRRTDTEGYNIIPRHTLVAGYKKSSKLINSQLMLIKKLYQNLPQGSSNEVP